MAESKLNDGGPAFPVVAEGGSTSQLYPTLKRGMSLRDYFAAHAPPPPRWWFDQYKSFWSESQDLQTAADHYVLWSFMYADAMLAASKK